jgi:hypothetical protein
MAATVTTVLGILLFAGQRLPNAAAADRPTESVSESPSDQPVAAPAKPEKPVPAVEKASTETCWICCPHRCIKHRVRSGRWIYCNCGQP